MNGEELKKFVPELLEARYPGRSKELLPTSEPELKGAGGWVLQAEEKVMLVKASATTHPFIWIRGGIAHALPRSEALALHVAIGNRDLVVGRLYMAAGDDIAMVAFDETIPVESLSLDHAPSVQDLVIRFETSIQYTGEWAKVTREKFGGQSFSADDAHLLSF